MCVIIAVQNQRRDLTMSRPQPTNIIEAIEFCTPMVNKLAHKWKRNHHTMFKDLQQSGMAGICEAWNRFEDSQHQKDGYKFTSYAWWWIRAYIRDEAMNFWEYRNNTTGEEAMVYGDQGYEMDERLMSVLREIEKLPARDQQMYQLRMDGYTFDEIAEEMGVESLHKVRNHLQKINAKLEEA